MLQNDYLVAKIGVDTAENEPRKESFFILLNASSRSRRDEARPLVQGVPGSQAGGMSAQYNYALDVLEMWPG